MVSRWIGPWPFHRSLDFRGPQCRLNDPGDTDRHLVLQIENVLKRAIETVGPEMSGALGFYQLRRDPDSPPFFPDRTFEHITHTEFVPDPFHVDRLPLVGEARI